MTLFDFGPACQRLIKALHSSSIDFNGDYLIPCETSSPDYYPPEHRNVTPPVMTTEFCSKALLHQLDYAANWVDSIKNKEDKPDWHFVWLSNEFDELYSVHAADNETDIIAFILASCDKIRVSLDKVELNENGITSLYSANKKILCFGKMQFEIAPDSGKLRAESALKGICNWDSTQELGQRLRNIQGLEKIDSSEFDCGSCRPLHPCANTMCIQIENFVNEIANVEIKRAQAQEFTASFFGFNNWQHLKAAEKKHGDNACLPYYFCPSDENNYPESFRFFLGLPTGLYFLGQHLKNAQDNTFTAHQILYFAATAPSAKLREIRLIYQEPDYLNDAKSIQKDNTIVSQLMLYFNNKLPLADRITTSNMRLGASKDSHLYLGNWIFWLLPRYRSKTKSIVGERYNPQTGKRVESIGGPQYKTSIIYNEHNQSFWLSIDWDRKPAYELTDLSISQIKLLEQKLILMEFWNETLGNKKEENEVYY